ARWAFCTWKPAKAGATPSWSNSSAWRRKISTSAAPARRTFRPRRRPSGSGGRSSSLIERESFRRGELRRRAVVHVEKERVHPVRAAQLEGIDDVQVRLARRERPARVHLLQHARIALVRHGGAR